MMDDEPWYVKRRRELEAAAPVKCKKVEPFVKMPLWWIETAARHARSPATLVMVELLRASWKAKSLSFPLSNGRLEKLGVSRDVKRRVLSDLERGGLIRVERRSRRTPIVTLLLL
jgi:hypothetical protein